MNQVIGFPKWWLEKNTQGGCRNFVVNRGSCGRGGNSIQCEGRDAQEDPQPLPTHMD